MIPVKQQADQLRLIAAWLLAAGLILTTSGWGGIIARALIPGDTQGWRCGQALCLCPPAPVPPACALCDAAIPNQSCPNTVPTPETERVLLFPSDPQQNLLRVPAVGEGFVLAAFIAGLRAADAPDDFRAERSFRSSMDQRRPFGPSRDVPTPPPRAARA